MQFEKLSIKDLFVITPRVFEDERGFFFESYNKEKFSENGIDINFVQDNFSRSTKGVLRGLHFQKPPHAQDKLVRVVKGEVLDVAVDIRTGSETFGQWEGVKLSAENKKMLLIPKGFAHAFIVLSDIADFEYKVSDFYAPETDAGIIWNDPDIGIDWGIVDPTVSEKDSKNQLFKDLVSPF